MTIYCDGDGSTGYCVVTDTGIVRHEILQGKQTSNTAEWEAMLEALRIASPGDTICADSQLIVNQLLGKYQVRDQKLKPLAEQGWHLLTMKSPVHVKWIRREENKAGLYLEGKLHLDKDPVEPKTNDREHMAEDEITVKANLFRRLAGSDFTGYRLRFIMALTAGAKTPSSIAEKTGIAQSTVKDIIAEFVDRNIVAINKEKMPYFLELLHPNGWKLDVRDVAL
jgi:ribonuclease HI